MKGVWYRKRDDLYAACWTDKEGKECSKSWSCKKFGKDEAFILATKFIKTKKEQLQHYREALKDK